MGAVAQGVANKFVRDMLKVETKMAIKLDKKPEKIVSLLSERDDKIKCQELALARLREQAKFVVAAVTAASNAGQMAERERCGCCSAILMRKNKSLKDELQSEDTTPSTRQDTLLREQIHELAAEVVAFTARIEGPESPICKALDKAPTSAANDIVVSLADKIRALQKTPAAE